MAIFFSGLWPMIVSNQCRISRTCSIETICNLILLHQFLPEISALVLDLFYSCNHDSPPSVFINDITKNKELVCQWTLASPTTRHAKKPSRTQPFKRWINGPCCVLFVASNRTILSTNQSTASWNHPSIQISMKIKPNCLTRFSSGDHS